MVQSYECIAITSTDPLSVMNIDTKFRINNHGVVVGSKWSEGKRIAFIYDGNDLQAINILTNYNAIVQDINDNGYIVGNIALKSEYKPSNQMFMIYGDEIDILDGKHMENGHIIAINNQQHILIRKNGWNSFIYKNGQLYPLDTSGNYRLQANDINDLDQVVGVGKLQEQNLSLEGAFVYSNRTINFIPKIVIDTLAKRINVALSLNNKGQIVGISGSNAKGRRAFEFFDNMLYDLGTIDTFWSKPLAINNYGDAVGYCSQPHSVDEYTQALLWRNRELINLNNYTRGTGWHLQIAVDINDKGQIIGQGLLFGVPHLFIMNPIGL